MANAQVIDQKEFKKLMRTLKEFPVKVQKNVVVGSTRAGANVVRDEMRGRVPKDSGALKKSITTKKRRNKGSTIRFSVMPKKVVLPNGSKSKDTRQYAYYLEYGTQKMVARSFIRPALTSVGNKPVTAARAYFTPRFKKLKAKEGFK